MQTAVSTGGTVGTHAMEQNSANDFILEVSQSRVIGSIAQSIYLIGGANALDISKVHDDVYWFHLESEQVLKGPSLIWARAGAVATMYNKTLLVVCGGRNASYSTNESKW